MVWGKIIFPDHEINHYSVHNVIFMKGFGDIYRRKLLSKAKKGKDKYLKKINLGQDSIIIES